MSKKLSPSEVVTHVLSTYVHAEQMPPGEVADMLATHASSSRAAVVTEYQALVKNHDTHSAALVTPPPAEGEVAEHVRPS